MIKIHQDLQEAVKELACEEKLREICIALIGEGVSPNVLLVQLQELRKHNGLLKEYEETILNAMDVLSDWCAPGKSLKI